MADGEDAAEIKTMQATQRCSHTGVVLTGVQVLRPLRFFVSDPHLVMI